MHDKNITSNNSIYFLRSPLQSQRYKFSKNWIKYRFSFQVYKSCWYDPLSRDRLYPIPQMCIFSRVLRSWCNLFLKDHNCFPKLSFEVHIESAEIKMAASEGGSQTCPKATSAWTVLEVLRSLWKPFWIVHKYAPKNTNIEPHRDVDLFLYFIWQAAQLYFRSIIDLFETIH